MTAKAALIKALLDGKILNIKNTFEEVGFTNAPREVGNLMREFKVRVNKTNRKGFSRYGQPVRWVDYNLEKNDYNKDGIEKMLEYLKKQKVDVSNFAGGGKANNHFCSMRSALEFA